MTTRTLCSNIDRLGIYCSFMGFFTARRNKYTIFLATMILFYLFIQLIKASITVSICVLLFTLLNYYIIKPWDNAMSMEGV